MNILAFFCRQRPDHRCRTAGCSGRGDADHLMCPDHRATRQPQSTTRRWLTNPALSLMADHMPRHDWASNWQGRRP